MFRPFLKSTRTFLKWVGYDKSKLTPKWENASTTYTTRGAVKVSKIVTILQHSQEANSLVVQKVGEIEKIEILFEILQNSLFETC